MADGVLLPRCIVVAAIVVGCRCVGAIAGGGTMEVMAAEEVVVVEVVVSSPS